MTHLRNLLKMQIPKSHSRDSSSVGVGDVAGMDILEAPEDDCDMGNPKPDLETQWSFQSSWEGSPS